jgi:hypothetical protein
MIRINTLTGELEGVIAYAWTYFWGFLSNEALHAAEQKWIVFPS